MRPPLAARRALAYLAMLGAAVVAFVVIRHFGHGLTAADVRGDVALVTTPRSATSHLLFHFLLALAAVIVVGQALGELFRRIGQPPVIGEVIGGILLGPSLLGAVSPAAYAYLLPTSLVPTLGLVAQLGVILYMFLVGLELNSERLRGQLHSTIAISHASIVVPFVLGATLALFLYPRLSTNAVGFTDFALFLGIAMSITAFPVLARILSDRGLTQTDVGTRALTCAAIGDVTAWCLLAFVVGVVQATTASAVQVAALTLVYATVMFVFVRPLVERRFGHDVTEPSRTVIVVTIVLLLLSALVTEAIGVHALFGAFLAGVVIPHESALARSLTQHLERIVTVLLLPAFFAFTGMRTEIGLVATTSDWLIVFVIVAVATAGKCGGTFLAARLTGLAPRPAATLGILMNTRGLMELIVLDVGLQMGVIEPRLFTMMVLMALVTTMATGPILERLKE